MGERLELLYLGQTVVVDIAISQRISDFLFCYALELGHTRKGDSILVLTSKHFYESVNDVVVFGTTA